MKRWILWILALGLFSCSPAPVTESTSPTLPNLVIIFCDDLGYGDLGTYGHPTIRTPHLDRMATEGQKWTNFYVAASVCTPSRAGLMTGRLPIRSGMCSAKRRVLFPNSGGGLPESELTIAEILRERGYKTGCVGKWHLGHLPQFLPTEHGFDSYYGIPYSNDMDRVESAPKGRAAFMDPKSEYWNVPLLRDKEIIERPTEQTTITRRYTEEAVSFINSNTDQPFFLYLAHSLPHVPLFRSKEFQGRSLRGLYGDVIEEIDWSVGRILSTLIEQKLDKRTIVLFTSDNGPWLSYNEQGGSAGLLREGKGSTWEGGMREPTLIWGPTNVEPGVVNEIGATLDILPTFVSLAGAELPSDRVLDGYDLTPVLKGNGSSPREVVFYYRDVDVWAVRKGPFKAHFITRTGYGRDKAITHDPPLLFNLQTDPSEKYNVAENHPEVITEILNLVEEHKNGVEEVTDQLAIPLEE